jgi:hypothetical protein
MENRLVVSVFFLLAFFLAPGVSSQASDSIGAALQQAYKKRTQGEISIYARSLDEVNSELHDLVPSSGSESVFPAVFKGWGKGPEAREAYRRLRKVVDKYNGWSKGYTVPIEIAQDAIQVKRWEALRPLILPESIGMGIQSDLGWSQPDGDAELWRQKGGALAYEMLLLFMWLDSPPGDIVNVDASNSWIEKEVGKQRLAQYRKMKGRLYQAFHGEYRFEQLEIPDLSEDAPVRIQSLVSRLGYRNPEDNLFMFIKQKDAFLTDLVGLIRDSLSPDESVSSISLDWFNCGSRWFPPFTLFEPETAENQVVKAIRKRPGNTFGFLQISKHSTQPVLREIGQSVLQCQVKAMTPQGKIVFPDTPWSTWTPKIADASAEFSDQERETADTTGFINMPEERPHKSRLGPAHAWSNICEWVAETVRHKGSGPIHLREGDSIDIPSLWLFAFGEKELADALSTVPGLTFVQEKLENDNQVQVKVDQVIADQSLHVQVLQGNQVLGQKDFPIEGPWPAWFASPRFPWSHGLKILPRLLPWILCILGICAAAFAITLNRKSTRFEGMRLLPLSCLIAAVIWTIIIGSILVPKPSGCKEIGGVVEFEVPADKSLTDIQKTIVQKISRFVFEVLAGLSDVNDVHAITRNWLQRFWAFVSSSAFSRPEIEMTKHSDNMRTALNHFDFRIRPVCYGGENPGTVQGRIAPGNGDRFIEEMARVMTAGGESDVPKSLLVGSPADATFCLSIYGGDHGRLDPPPAQSPLSDAPPSFVLFMPGPSRDGYTARDLLCPNRWEWTSKRAKTTVSLMRGIGTPLTNALSLPRSPNETTSSPEDMDLKTLQWWGQVKSKAKSGVIEKVGQEVAARSFNLFQANRVPSSKSELALSDIAVLGRIFGSALCLLLACLLAATCQEGLWSGKTARKCLLWTLCAITIAVLAIGAWYATVAAYGFSYEGSIMRSFRFAWYLLAGMISLLILVRLGLWGYNRRQPTAFCKAISAGYLLRPKFVRIGAWRSLFGLVLMGGACAIWIGGLTHAPGRCSWEVWLLPIDHPNGLLAGLGLWGLGMSCILFPGAKKGEENEQGALNFKGLERRKDGDIFS